MSKPHFPRPFCHLSNTFTRFSRGWIHLSRTFCPFFRRVDLFFQWLEVSFRRFGSSFQRKSRSFQLRMEFFHTYRLFRPAFHMPVKNVIPFHPLLPEQKYPGGFSGTGSHIPCTGLVFARIKYT